MQVWCFCCRTISKYGELDAFLHSFSLSKFDFYDGNRNHAWSLKVKSSAWWWLKWRLNRENLLFEDLPFFFFSVCWIKHMLECLRKNLNKSIPCPPSVTPWQILTDRISHQNYIFAAGKSSIFWFSFTVEHMSLFLFPTWLPPPSTGYPHQRERILGVPRKLKSSIWLPQC